MTASNESASNVVQERPPLCVMSLPVGPTATATGFFPGSQATPER